MPGGRTHESRGVVVLDGLCVSKSLQDGIGLQQLLLQLPLQVTTGFETVFLPRRERNSEPVTSCERYSRRPAAAVAAGRRNRGK